MICFRAPLVPGMVLAVLAGTVSPLVADEQVGWRGNGNSYFPDARPPHN